MGQPNPSTTLVAELDLRKKSRQKGSGRDMVERMDEKTKESKRGRKMEWRDGREIVVKVI